MFHVEILYICIYKDIREKILEVYILNFDAIARNEDIRSLVTVFIEGLEYKIIEKRKVAQLKGIIV